MSAQPKALFLADVIEADPTSAAHHDEAAAELRRLHAENESLHEKYHTAIKQAITKRTNELLAQRDALLEALQALYDEQNGPPLIRHQAAWEAAMEKARAAIKAVEEGK